jgi:hypothetical protein
LRQWPDRVGTGINQVTFHHLSLALSIIAKVIAVQTPSPLAGGG